MNSKQIEDLKSMLRSKNSLTETEKELEIELELRGMIMSCLIIAQKYQSSTLILMI